MAGVPKPNFRALLAQGKTLPMAWLGSGLPLAIEYAVEAGWKAAMLDQQHGLGGPSEQNACLTAARAAGVPALVRVACLDFGLIGRALDAGAQGVIVPMVDSADAAARVAHATKYPPLGGRSHGPYRGRLLTDGDYFTTANSWTVACGQIETRQAVDNIEGICAVEGFDMICLGPNDLAISLSGGKSRDIRAPLVLETIEHVRQVASRRGVITSIFANDANYASHMIDTGWQVVSVGTDLMWLAKAAREMLPANVS